MIILTISTICIGILMGLIGTGGGILLLITLHLLGFTIQQAVATTLFLQLVPNTIFGAWMYFRNGHLLLKESMIAAIATTIGVVVGSHFGSKKYIDDKYIYLLITAILFIAGFYMLFISLDFL